MFKFLIEKTVYWYPHYKLKTRWIEIKAESLLAARKEIENNFPDWTVSMCWPVWGN